MTWKDPIEGSAPPKKRTRTETRGTEHTRSTPRLFAPFRALGLVTNHVPFVLQTRSFKGATEGPRIHILTCLGRSWALWEGGKMTLLFVGPDSPEPISYLAMIGDAIWACSGPHLLKYLRGKEVGRMTDPLGAVYSFILSFGDQLVVLTEDGSRMVVWDCNEMEVICSIEFDNGFTATSVIHPATYLNKVLVASSQGNMQLWNIRTKTCIHKFSSKDISDSNGSSAITALTQSPAIDVVGIGFASGEISLYDIRTDERLMRIYMDGGPVRGLAFRSDGEPVLASASSSGHIALWDLNNGGRLIHTIRGAHDRAVTSIEWVPGQPVLISAGEDNCVKQWFSESPTSLPTLLKYRSGHHEPPYLIRYYGEDGKQLLTASGDRSLRCTSVVRDSRSFELSQGHIAKKATSPATPVASLKFSPITQLSYSSTRSKDWDDVLTSHKQETTGRTWSVREKKTGKWIFNPVDAGSPKDREKKKKKAFLGTVQAVCVSACGNFGFIGSSTGEIQMYNMQSVMWRRKYDLGVVPVDAVTRPQAAEGGRVVNGIATDALNKMVIASTSEGVVTFFDFHTQDRLDTIVLPSTCTSILLQRDSGLLAVTCGDRAVRLVDIETRRVVRELRGFKDNILDVTFSPDSRWLIATSLDSIVRTFDIPSGLLVDAFRTASVATSVSFSPTSDFLATSHVDSVGIYLWANKAQYSEVSLRGITEDAVLDEISLPIVQGADEDEALEALQVMSIEEAPDVHSTPLQLGGDLITLTLLPRTRWQTLLNLEVIQQRNKPKEPPKPPEKAPFFLPTLPGVEHRFAVLKDDVPGELKERQSKRLEAGATQADSTFHRKLVSEDPEGDYDEFFDYVKTVSPAAIDLELRAIGSSLEGLRTFLTALRQRLRAHRDFEAVQALIAVLLRLHGEVFIANPELRISLEELRASQVEESRCVLDLISASLGALNFVRDML